MEQSGFFVKNLAAEFLNLSNGNFNMTIHSYSEEEAQEKDVIVKRGIKCTSVNQTINDLLSDENLDEQVIMESLSNYYYEHKESFEGMIIEESNRKLFEELRQDVLLSIMMSEGIR